MGVGPIPACAGQPLSGASARSCAWAYPRVCGATAFSTPRGLPRQGLSPRVRGNQPLLHRIDMRRGPIPACAGQPARRCPRAALRRAYPRVCGATRYIVQSVSRRQGLSPRVRGNHVLTPLLSIVRGPIPACAGQPQVWHAPRFAGRAYPRVCGATFLRPTLTRHTKGLSPRVRGNRGDGIGRTRALGPIPACAGQPRSVERMGRCFWAYPRVCGATTD